MEGCPIDMGSWSLGSHLRSLTDVTSTLALTDVTSTLDYSQSVAPAGLWSSKNSSD